MTSEAEDSSSSDDEGSNPARSSSSRRTPISAERWRRMVGLVEVALDLEKPLRGAYLEAVTRQDPELRRQVHRMLRQFDGFIELPTPEREGSGGQAGLDAERIGPYRLLRVLGRGGMGVVYLAERRDAEFERQVAIKIIGAGQDLPIVHQRFLSERQILARFDHPNIARLFEGGTTADGRPYFVLEYIDGLPLDAHCEEHQLPLEERLQLFVDVCGAVAYAHQNLVVHRDLKPSNILVDRDGKAKLLDFGIAKLLDPSAMPFSVEQTRTSMRPMTPSYAAPEQVAGVQVTTATDVYSLGVLLFRLLTGRLPFDLSGQLSTDEMIGLLRQDAPRPSQTLAAALQEGMPPATWNGQDAHRIVRSLRGDLDNIVRKAMRYEPQQRYSSVGKLADDLRRYQQGEPVTATRDTPIYSLKKFVRKYRWVVAATLLLMLTLATFAFSARRQAREIARERDKAEESARDARLTRDFLVGMLQVADASSLKDNKVPLDALLDQGFARLEKGEVANAAVRVELLQVLAESYQSLRDFRQAARAWEQAAKLAAEQQRPDGDLFKLHMAAAQAFTIGADLAAAAAELEQARRYASGEGRIELDLSLLNMDLHLSRPEVFRQRAAALLATMPEYPEDDRLLLAIVATYAYFREVQGHAEDAARISRWVLDRPGPRSAPERYEAAIDNALSALQAAYFELNRLDEYLMQTSVIAQKLVRGGQRPHAGSLLARTDQLHVLVVKGRLAEADREIAELRREIAKLIAVDPNEPRAQFVLGKVLVLAGEIERSRHPGRPPSPEAVEALQIFERLYRTTGNLRVGYFYFRSLLLNGRREEARPVLEGLLAHGVRERRLLDLATSAGLDPAAPPIELALAFPPWLENELAAVRAAQL